MCLCANHKIYFFQSILKCARPDNVFRTTNNVLTIQKSLVSKQISPCVFWGYACICNLTHSILKWHTVNYLLLNTTEFYVICYSNPECIKSIFFLADLNVNKKNEKKFKNPKILTSIRKFIVEVSIDCQRRNKIKNMRVFFKRFNNLFV